MGDIPLELDADAAPKAVTNFVILARGGYYDDLIFHRVIPQFMIQGGAPYGDGTGNASIYGALFEDEINDIKLERGVIAMANAGPDSNGSQFFIVQADETPWLDGRHTVFGKVSSTSGMDVVDAIAAVKRDEADKPVKPVTFTVEVEERLARVSLGKKPQERKLSNSAKRINVAKRDAAARKLASKMQIAEPCTPYWSGKIGMCAPVEWMRLHSKTVQRMKLSKVIDTLYETDIPLEGRLAYAKIALGKELHFTVTSNDMNNGSISAGKFVLGYELVELRPVTLDDETLNVHVFEAESNQGFPVRYYELDLVKGKRVLSVTVEAPLAISDVDHGEIIAFFESLTLKRPRVRDVK